MEQFKLSRRKILSVAKALLAAYGVTAVLLLILALLLLKLNLSEGIVAVGIMATYLISCFLGGFLLGKAWENTNSSGDWRWGQYISYF